MKSVFIVLALLPAAAFAHPGDHAQVAFRGNLRHLISEADHLGMLALALVGLAVVVWLRKGRTE